jgi:hypothetical protein
MTPAPAEFDPKYLSPDSFEVTPQMIVIVSEIIWSITSNLNNT